MDLQNAADNLPRKQRGTIPPERVGSVKFSGDLPDPTAIRLRMPTGQFCFREKKQRG